MADERKVPVVISLTSGKGGVGKTNICINLAYCLHKLGKKTLIVDADLGMANVDIMLGLTPGYNLFHLFSKDLSLKKIILSTEYGFDVLPGVSGVAEMLSLDTGQKLELLEIMDQLEDKLDFMIVDTGAGINDSVIYFNLAVQQRVLVMTPEPTSLTDTYALIKVLKFNHGVERFRVVINMAKNRDEAIDTFKRLSKACDHFLSGVSLDLIHTVPLDENVKKAVSRQSLFCQYAPDAKASRAIMSIAESMVDWKPVDHLDGNIKFFWKTLLFQESF